MKIFRSDDGKAAFVRLLPGDDLLQGLNRAAAELGYDAATLSIVGGVQNLVVACFDQQKKEYRDPLRYDEAMVISGGTGNVSLKDGKPFVHIHVTGSDSEGKSAGGHLMDGTRVYMIEAYFRVLEGPAPVRELDAEVGLPVWH
ncbi:MAG: PPC domain-containing DNA-binding protein [Actinomycetota bacterium]